ncbi:MgPa adhesin [Mycoplasmoides genitalium M6320]|uniref:MgPa adhesin n=1 Tax=Mycoplasmoides genitalium M6320 TaxID=662945 RepID=A0ABC7ZI33_MYCGT|nr:MgPa adhesin [Mycoplasmoides genitalium M6320]
MKSGQYQTTNTYHRLIEPDKWQSNSDLTNMTSLLKLLTTKNIKQKLGKTAAQSQENNGGGEMIKMFLNNYINSLKLTKLFFHFELLFEKSY